MDSALRIRDRVKEFNEDLTSRLGRGGENEAVKLEKTALEIRAALDKARRRNCRILEGLRGEEESLERDLEELVEKGKCRERRNATHCDERIKSVAVVPHPSLGKDPTTGIQTERNPGGPPPGWSNKIRRSELREVVGEEVLTQETNRSEYPKEEKPSKGTESSKEDKEKRIKNKIREWKELKEMKESLRALNLSYSSEERKKNRIKNKPRKIESHPRKSRRDEVRINFLSLFALRDKREQTKIKENLSKRSGFKNVNPSKGDLGPKGINRNPSFLFLKASTKSFRLKENEHKASYPKSPRLILESIPKLAVPYWRKSI